MLKPFFFFFFFKKKMEIKRCQRKLHTWQRCQTSLGFCWAAAHGANIGRALRDSDPMHSLACKEAFFVFLTKEQRRATTLSGRGRERMLLSAPSFMRTALASARPLEGFSLALGSLSRGQADELKRSGGRNAARALVTAGEREKKSSGRDHFTRRARSSSSQLRLQLSPFMSTAAICLYKLFLFPAQQLPALCNVIPDFNHWMFFFS